MSYTAIYSELMALEVDDGERLDRAPRILDYDGWRDEDWADVPNMSPETLRKTAIVQENEDYSAYPKQTWKVLKGFKTWTPKDLLDKYDSVREAWEDLEEYTDPLGFDFNLERVGIGYGGLDGVWKSLFEAVSEYTEPFAVYHSPYEYNFADVTDFHGVDDRSVYYIEVVDGAVYVEEQTFEHVATEPLVTDRDPVAVEREGGANP